MSTSELKTTAAPSSVPPVADVPHQTVSTEPVVVGAGKIEEPAKALEGLAEPDILDKARDMVKPYLDKMDATAKPYLEKVQATTKPYTDAAAAKAKEVIEKIEGTQPHAAVVGTAQPVALDKSADASASASASTSTTTGSTAGDVGEKAKGLFAQVQSTFTQLTHSIDERTASTTHPGIITQVTQAIEKGVEKVDSFIEAKTAPTTGAAVAGEHPVQTTTNTVPHPAAASDPVVVPAALPQ
ncbi:hypothetical protein EHS25_009567 [Saitozyma podzolica]|uniref:Uncharacterized protein n=1 Tax=Saitozyma podzolica TaxID=1890683 RepID=A0A427YJK6_9TREE|nr:hypothetical protein EHS25_009567 [Saitozyma podzolica]